MLKKIIVSIFKWGGGGVYINRVLVSPEKGEAGNTGFEFSQGIE